MGQWDEWAKPDICILISTDENFIFTPKSIAIFIACNSIPLPTKLIQKLITFKSENIFVANVKTSEVSVWYYFFFW